MLKNKFSFVLLFLCCLGCQRSTIPSKTDTSDLIVIDEDSKDTLRMFDIYFCEMFTQEFLQDKSLKKNGVFNIKEKIDIDFIYSSLKQAACSETGITISASGYLNKQILKEEISKGPIFLKRIPSAIVVDLSFVNDLDTNSIYVMDVTQTRGSASYNPNVLGEKHKLNDFTTNWSDTIQYGIGKFYNPTISVEFNVDTKVVFRKLLGDSIREWQVNYIPWSKVMLNI